MGTSLKTGWTARLTTLSLAVLLFEGITGLAVTVSPFHAAVEWGLLVHTMVGVVTLAPVAWYHTRHWRDHAHEPFSAVVLLGYLATAALAVCALSGVVVTWQGLFGVRMSPAWRDVHLVSTLVALATALPLMAVLLLRARTRQAAPAAGRLVARSLGVTLAGLAVIGVLSGVYSGREHVDELPESYSFLHGPDRPFAPSLARTSTGGALDARSLAGSESCGSSGCHEQIVAEWKPSSHRYYAMDVLFQGAQKVMAEQNGPESVRYCGGCHDPISLFSGTESVLVEGQSEKLGYEEGVSCLVCHAIRETDLQGNAHYVVARHREYLWQSSQGGLGQWARDFLIRTYPDEHNKLSRRSFKGAEYCAACHKQLVDEEVDDVGWVQLQNQYDTWKASRWYHEGDPGKTIECRECHMPLVTSSDPAAGDDADDTRGPADGKHRSHRFIGANSMMPKLLGLEGWEEQVRQTELWLKGQLEIPEIRGRWTEGPVILLGLEVPESVSPGETIPLRVTLTANKVGHDFPTGPLDVIQSWVELYVEDQDGHVIFSSGTRDDEHRIEPGSFLFKAEPVDQEGNLIDRQNLWEMVGVRYRRALFPGRSDSVEYQVSCPSDRSRGGAGQSSRRSVKEQPLEVPSARGAGELTVTAILNYRKVDPFLLSLLLGEESGVTAPVVEMTRATATIMVDQGG